LKIIQDVNKRVYTVPGTYWNTRYPSDCVRNIHVVNGRGYMLPGTHAFSPLFPIGTRNLHSSPETTGQTKIKCLSNVVWYCALT